MEASFSQCADWVLIHEGGFVDHPKDPGGATNMGVTQRVYDAYRLRKHGDTQSVQFITRKEAFDIYKSQYWDTIKADEMPAGIDYALFDFAVNSGPSRAIKTAQEILHIKADGVVGEITLRALTNVDEKHFIEILCNRRLAFMRSLKTWETFGNGWTDRVMGRQFGPQNHDHGVIDRAMWLVNGRETTAAHFPTRIGPGKSLDIDTKTSVRLQKEAADPMNVLKVGGAGLVSFAAASGSLPQGPIQWAVALCVVVGLCYAGYSVFRRKRA